MWALGVTLFYIITGDYPYDAKNLFDLQDKVLNKDINFDVIKNQNLKELLQRILEKDPNKRATLEEILVNSWVTNKGTETIQLQEVDVYSHGFGNINQLLKLR